MNTNEHELILKEKVFVLRRSAYNFYDLCLFSS